MLNINSGAEEGANADLIGRGAWPISLKGLLAVVITPYVPHSWGEVMLAGANVAALSWALIKIRRMASQATAFSFAIICALLLSYVSHVSDLILVLLPLSLLKWNQRGLVVALVALIALPLPLTLAGDRLYLLAIPLTVLAVLVGLGAPQMGSASAGGV